MLALATMSAFACAQEAETDAFAARGTRLRLLWQNDSWASDSDRFFTNAFEVSGAFGADVDTLGWLPFRDGAQAATHEFAIGQDMFTPEDISLTTPDPQDRPYAGWLHLSYRNAALTLNPDRRDHLDVWELELGVVGPSSLADDLQIQIHEMVDAPRPSGWSHQLHDEPGILIGYERRFRTWYHERFLGPFSTDLVGLLGARLGNVETSGRLGTTLRLGCNLPRHFGTALRPAGDAPQRFHFEAGVEGRLVLRNIFLDGNTWRSSPSVDRNVFVADFTVGLVWEPTPFVRFSLLETFRTPEFDSPSAVGDPSHFTSVQLDLIF